jgi:hypothetical protein
VVGFSPTEGDMVRVHRKLISKSFDGFPWMGPPLKSYPRHVFDDMMVAMRLDPENKVLRVPFSGQKLLCRVTFNAPTAYIRVSFTVSQALGIRLYSTTLAHPRTKLRR